MHLGGDDATGGRALTRRGAKCALAAIFFAAMSVGAHAAELGTGPWVKGYTDIFGGLPAQPGLYIRDDLYRYQGNADKTVLDGLVELDVQETYTADIAALSVVTPLKILGGTYAVAVAPSVVAMIAGRISTEAQGTPQAKLRALASQDFRPLEIDRPHICLTPSGPPHDAYCRPNRGLRPREWNDVSGDVRQGRRRRLHGLLSIRGGKYWLWRAVDNEGEVLDFLVQGRREKGTSACSEVAFFDAATSAPPAVVSTCRTTQAMASGTGGADGVWSAMADAP